MDTETINQHKATTRTRTLDDLAGMSEEQLRTLYCAATVGAVFFEREGRPKGRMLAVRKLATGTPFASLKSFARNNAFPWGGKSFFRVNSSEGRGINWVRLPLGRFEWFPFDPRLEKSLVDGEDTIVLDYDKPENPFFIRRIHDEIREVEPGLFLGPAMWKQGGREAAHVLWFALDFKDEELT